jgi:hypothetical protein
MFEGDIPMPPQIAAFLLKAVDPESMGFFNSKHVWCPNSKVRPFNRALIQVAIAKKHAEMQWIAMPS